MSFQISITPTGQRGVDALRGKARKSFDAALRRLASKGCAAADYRLSGEVVDHICSLQLYGQHRVLVCFPDDESVVILIVAEHRDSHPELDVYRSLYRLLELPEPSTKRTKPPCCDESGKPPIDPDLLDDFRERAATLNRRTRRSRRSR